MKEYRMLIDGRLVESESANTFDTYDPATGKVIAKVPQGDKRDVDRAVEAAHQAFAGREWSRMSPVERGRLMVEMTKLIKDNLDELAEVDTRDGGKAISEARGDVALVARYFEYYGGMADKLQGETIPLGQGYLNYTVREPLGVTAHIVPWNYPLSLAARGLAPALVCGNTAVVKPPSPAPLSLLLLGEILQGSSLPKGVLNVITGPGGELGETVSAHPKVMEITFTGSVETGRRVMKRAAEAITPLSLELGGKSPQIVFPDADLERVVKGVIGGIFTANAGQICSAGSRLLLHQKIHDRVLERLIEATKALTIGPGMEDPDIGPLISQGQLESVMNYIHIGKEEGAQLLTGGFPPDDPRLEGGYFLEPTIFGEVESRMRIAQEEIFGPVLAVISFEDEEEAIEIANDTIYGLVAGVWTRDLGRALRMASRVEAGQIFINEYLAGGVETPFGGYKGSGFGREKGLEALRYYTQLKNVCVNQT